MTERTESFSELPAYVQKSSKKPKLLLIFLLLFLLAGAIIVGLFFLGGKNKKLTPQLMFSAPTHEATPSPAATQSASLTPAVSPTQAASLDRSKLQVAVLNGSGTAGAAKGTSSYLNGLGYNITTIGNADSFDYRNLTVYVKKSKSNYLDQLKKDLLANPGSASVSASIKDTITTDAEVIVGQ